MDNLKPAADPSEMTTAQLHREITSLKELIYVELDSIKKSIDLAHADFVRVPTDVQKAVENLRQLHEEKFISLNDQFEKRVAGLDMRLVDIAALRDEKFASVEKQFRERDTRIEQTSKDSKVAVDAALQAAKELVAQQNISISQANSKQEASFSKQIDQQALLITTTTNATNDKINDLKERFAAWIGQGTGKKDFWGYIVGAVGLLATIGAIVSMLLKK